MTETRYVVIAPGGVRPDGMFYPYGARLYLTQAEIEAFDLGADVRPADRLSPTERAAALATGIQSGDVLTLHRAGVEIPLSPIRLVELAAFLTPLLGAAPPPIVPDPIAPAPAPSTASPGATLAALGAL